MSKASRLTPSVAAPDEAKPGRLAYQVSRFILEFGRFWEVSSGQVTYSYGPKGQDNLAQG